MKTKISVLLLSLVLLFNNIGKSQSQNTLSSISEPLGEHYNGSKYVVSARQISQGNNDSIYYSASGHVGTIADSLGDSLIFILPNINQNGGWMDIGIMDSVKSDTLIDSLLIYENNKPLYSYKVANVGATDVYFPFIGGNPYQSFVIPIKFTFKPKWKRKAGKGAHTARIVTNYIKQ